MNIKLSQRKILSKTLLSTMAVACCTVPLIFPNWQTVLAESYISDVLDGNNVNEINIANAVEDLCLTGANGNSSRQASQQLQTDCNALVGQAFSVAGDGSNVGLFSNELRQSINRVALEQVSSISTNTFNRISVNINSIANRMLALRDNSATRYALYGDAPQGGAAGSDDDFDRLGVFFNTRYRKFDQKGNNLEDGYNTDIWNFIVGADYRFTDNLIFGAAANYGSDDVDIDRNTGRIRSNKYGISLYGTFYATQQFFIDGVVGYEWGNNRIRRNINYVLSSTPVSVNQRATSSPDSNEIFASLGTGYLFNINSLMVTPTLRFEYAHIFLDGFRESMSNPTASGGGLALKVASDDFKSLSSNLGIRLNYSVNTAYGIITPQAHVEWIHEFEDQAKVISARFANDVSGLGGFKIVTQAPDRDYINLQLGLSAQLGAGRSGFLSFNKTFEREDITDYSITAGVRAEF
ncbi:MAG: autotransporter outer membrane beta-barrel domain-containing protein [Methylococcales bacterium]